MTDRIEELRRQFREDLAGVISLERCAEIRDKWLGRESGIITGEMKRLRELPKEERPAFGEAANRLRSHVESEISVALERLREQAKRDAMSRNRTDVTRPGSPFELGVEHPIKRLQAE